ncbi:MAG: hypothetical protein HQK81_12480 [Desulfovibrionaceae bacterium]|nr:hypothetical protein [Desulfovibrionaceae bacterium]MBF0514860.1 hypothetical protein [Desulfovibrionaceae bacterium]
MKIKSLPVWLFVGFEACLCLVILLKVAPLALKVGSFFGLAGALAAAIPWSLAVTSVYAAARWALKARA